MGMNIAVEGIQNELTSIYDSKPKTIEEFKMVWDRIGIVHDRIQVEVNRSKSFLQGKVIFDADKEIRRSGKFGLKDLYREIGIGKNTALRVRNVYERVIGIDMLLDGVGDSNGNIDTGLMMISKDDTETSEKIPSPHFSKKGEMEFRSFTKGEMEILTAYRDAVNGNPTMSRAFDDVPAYTKARCPNTGNKEYSLLQEAYLYDEALAYFDTKKITVKQLREYLTLTVTVAHEVGGVEPWEVTDTLIEEYEEAQNVEEIGEDAVTPAQTQNQAPIAQDAKAEEVVDVEVDDDIEESLRCSAEFPEFVKWYTDIKCGIPDTMTRKFEHIAGDTINTIANIDDIEWNGFRKRMLALVHPDKGGSEADFIKASELFSMVSAFRESQQLLNNFYNRNEKTTQIHSMDWEHKKPLYEEYLRYKENNEKGGE